MNKIAQRRSRIKKLYESINRFPFTGPAAEKFFQPQLAQVLENLRTVDSNVRSMVAGRSLEGGDPGTDPVGLKDLLKSAKTNIAKLEYMAALADLGRFHKKMYDIRVELVKLNQNVDEIHHQFLFQDMGEEQKQQLRDLRKRWASAMDADHQLRKEAGLLDFFKHMLSDRGKALRFYKRKYPAKAKHFEIMTKNLLSKSEKMLNTTIASLKAMDSARAARNPESYMAAAKPIMQAFKNYDEEFKNAYEGKDGFKSFLDGAKELEEKIEAPAAGKTELVNNPLGILPPVEEGSEVPTEREPDHVTVVPSGGDPATVQPTGSTMPSPREEQSGTSTVVPTGGSAPVARTPGAPLGADLMNYLQEAQEIQNKSPTTPSPAVTESGTQSIAPAKSPTMIGVAPDPNKPRETQFYAGSQRRLPPMLSHGKFWESLQAMSNEHPAILRSFIKKYAQGIQGNDPATALQLLQIARAIRG